MTDYEALNRRLRAERPKPLEAGSAAWRHVRDTIAYSNLTQLEQKAAMLHRIWESKGFPDGKWLEVEGTEKLAWHCADEDWNSPSLLYVMIDGRLVHYHKQQLGARFGSPRPAPQIFFMTIREEINRESKGLTATDHMTKRYLELMDRNLELIRKL